MSTAFNFNVWLKKSQNYLTIAATEWNENFKLSAYDSAFTYKVTKHDLYYYL